MRTALGTRTFAALSMALVLAAFALRMRVLDVGFTVDDYAQVGMMKGYFPVARQPLDLFTFSTGDVAENERLRVAGTFPWWSRADLRVSHFRPLSSALMWLDLTLFGNDAYAYHLHSAAWWFAMMAVLTLVLRSLLPPLPALLALAICCAHSSHGMFLGWIANRNAIVASVFALGGLWFLLRSGESISARARACAVVAFGIALGAGEYAIGYLAYPLCYEWTRAQPVRKRWIASIPWIAVVALYGLIRTSLGFGTRGSGMYIDPLAETGAFLHAAIERLPVSIGDVALGIQSNWWSAGFPWALRGAELGLWPISWASNLRNQQLLLVACGLIAFAFAGPVAVLLYRARGEYSRTRWLLLATALALVPSLSSVSESRLLLPPQFGWSVIVATCAWMAFESASDGARGLARRALVTAVAAALLLGPPCYAADMVQNFPALASTVRRSILAPALDSLRGRRVLLLGAADATTTIYLPLVRRVHGRSAPRSSQLLTSTFSNQRLRRVSLTSFVIERYYGALDALDVYATAFNRNPLQTGDSFASEGMIVTIEQAFEGRPIRTRYALDRSLDDPDLALVVQDLSGLRSVAFPAIGETLEFGPPLLPLGLGTRHTGSGG